MGTHTPILRALLPCLLALGLALGLAGCASKWKIHGGPQECAKMCQRWGMQLTGMVGVGDQSSTGPGATACVCELPGAGGEAPVASAGSAAGTAAVIVALQEEERQQQQQQQHMRRNGAAVAATR